MKRRSKKKAGDPRAYVRYFIWEMEKLKGFVPPGEPQTLMVEAPLRTAGARLTKALKELKADKRVLQSVASFTDVLCGSFTRRDLSGIIRKLEPFASPG